MDNVPKSDAPGLPYPTCDAASGLAAVRLVKADNPHLITNRLPLAVEQCIRHQH
ncbi:hypothetical protein [Floridanema flaviceps]|uniref:hypothetical protein n=1 Tax=Floridanema flaviceps TaxID=3396170 RepID=UPI0039A72B0A